jgi:CHAD domain-containing protein
MKADKLAVSADLDQFVRLHASRLLGKLVFQVKRTSKHPDEEAIHDLRVSIRRFAQCLREFRPLFRRHRSAKILKQLEKMMDLAAETRNLDIALELLRFDRRRSNRVLAAGLLEEREQAQLNLTRALEDWRRRDFSRKWRPWLDR